MTQHSHLSAEYANQYVQSHNADARDQNYFLSYWRYLMLDRLYADSPFLQEDTNMLEEGGGTCGIWQELQYDHFTSVDLSTEMTQAAEKIYADDANKTFLVGDVFDASLAPDTYHVIMSNAFGNYYRPNAKYLQRFFELLKPGGCLSLATDPCQKPLHHLCEPVGDLIDRHVRLYTRISNQAFLKMASQVGFKVWLSTLYEAAPGWQRQYWFLRKP
ncbi:MAG: class I SAM-dependent methyltransferase [Pseudomonadota bacterium]